MAKLRSAWLVSAVTLGSLAALSPVAGCGSTEDSIFDGSLTDADGGGAVGTAPPDFGLGVSEGGTAESFAKIVITPEDAVVAVDLDAKSPVTAYSAKGIRADGTEVPLTGAWSFSRIDAAAFEGNRLVPTGFVGGKGEVSFKSGSQVAKTGATFKLRVTAGAAPEAAVVAAFAGATEPDAALTLIYPYDKTVFPRGLPSPILQWTGGAAADVYKVEAKSDTFEYVGYATAPPPARYAFPKLPADIWAKLTDSTIGDVTVSVQRWDGTKAYVAKTQTWTVAGGNLKGTVYYTRLKQGAAFVRRLEMGGTAESFLQQTSGVSCIACHSVSRDGSRIVASVNGGASPWAVYDTASGNELYRSTQSSGFQAISPTGSHVLWRHWNGGGFGTEGKLRLSTSTSDAVLTELTLPAGTPGGPGHPVWSPDGKRIAFSVRTAGDGLNFTASTLWTTDIDLTAATPSFTGTKKIVEPNALPVVTYPTFSPDSQWIGFMRANQSRSDGANPRGELWLASADGATQLRLDRANGVPDLGATPDKSWGPSFHPVAAGGYFWVAFFSQRPYGHQAFTSQRQVWIAAVDAAPKAGQDPSHPAFYITGQDDDSYNERPQFTVNPCKPLGQSCENGYDCCDGYCRAGADGKLACQQKGAECAESGDKCATDGDCCAGLTCLGGFCAVPAPK